MLGEDLEIFLIRQTFLDTQAQRETHTFTIMIKRLKAPGDGLLEFTTY